ncbi:tyrosine-type DNA invertase [Morganella morganii]|uniref:tyrosine-type DNA invertase n=1 Tax=Morganella morganii TaxID=582 RepID=UPI000D9E83B7|nr:tyrosine-type DNA invertase [Morganella morganii]SPX81836.1 Tyrosine recombinase XerC [Morganella morganii]
MRNYLTSAEVDLLLLSSKKTRHSVRNSCLIYMSFIHGFRVSEICRLRLSDIDLNSRQIFIFRLKNGFSTTHPIVPKEYTLLINWLNLRKQYVGTTTDDYVFLTPKGTPLSRHTVYRMIKLSGKDAGLSISAHPHMLRHACGYALADRRIDTRLIQDYLGHVNITHTVRYTASNSLRFKGIWS